MKIQFTDLKAQFRVIGQEIRSAIDLVLEHGQFIMGPEIEQFEKRLSDFVGTKHVITCASGTDALLMPLMAYGVDSGDAIFTTPFTFIATAEVISLLGATPVFVDIDPHTFNLDPESLENQIQIIKKKGVLRIRGIISVDLFGLPANYNALKKIAVKHDLFLLEDAAQSLGATIQGKKSGALGDVGATSFFPSKPLGCYGDGGAIFTNNDTLAEVMRSIRVHGQGKNKYDNVRLGLNARLDTLQAAILLKKMDHFEKEILMRNQVATRYSEALSHVATVPHIPEGSISAWAQYSIRTRHRDKLQSHLKKAGIPTAIYYPKPLHLQDAYKNIGKRVGDFPIAEHISSEILSLPMYPYLATDQQDFIIEEVKKGLCQLS